MNKNFRIALGTYILMLILIGIGTANIPPPPVNQNFGMYDTDLGNLTNSTCRACHVDMSKVHNSSTSYSCNECHPNGYSPSEIDRNCLNCHNGTPYYANPNLKIGKPHHNTTKNSAWVPFQVAYWAIDRKCRNCHGAAVVSNYDDGHIIPTSSTSIMSNVCNNCHEQNLSSDPSILTNSKIHHEAISETQGFQCTYCHASSGNNFPIKECEQCHSLDQLHMQYFPSVAPPGYNHIGSDWDCKGCHTDIDHGDDCKECHPSPITTPIPYIYKSKIRGTKFNDSNQNGIKDPGEPGVPGISINLKRIIAPGIDEDVGSVVTNFEGNYTFVNLSAGNYKVREIGVSGISQTYPANGAPHYVSISDDEVLAGIDFGNNMLIPGKISGKKFNDTNGNGILDIGESGMSGINISLYPSGRVVTTNSTGGYTFNNVPPGVYSVYEQFITGYIPTTPNNIITIVKINETSIVNFGNKKILPPPPDISITQQVGSQNGIPTVPRGLSRLTIRKNLSSISNIIEVVLILRWADGTTKTANMILDASTGIWKVNLDAPFQTGIARMTFNVDISPIGSGPEDIIQIGDIIFLDPSGQIRSSCDNQPIEGAEATLYVEFPPTTGKFIVSPPGYQLESNPQTTSADGLYNWMTIPGTFKVKVTKTGYNSNESEPVIVPPPRTGLDILLAPTNGCQYDFTGFFPPVENPPVINKVNPGSAIPLKFSLDGYQGIDIFEIDYPKSSVISCEGPIDNIGENETVTAGESGLSYNQTTDQYNYIWKTDKKWTDCRQLVMKLNDGIYHRANFGFFK